MLLNTWQKYYARISLKYCWLLGIFLEVFFVVAHSLCYYQFQVRARWMSAATREERCALLLCTEAWHWSAERHRSKQGNMVKAGKAFTFLLLQENCIFTGVCCIVEEPLWRCCFVVFFSHIMVTSFPMLIKHSFLQTVCSFGTIG